MSDSHGPGEGYSTLEVSHAPRHDDPANDAPEVVFPNPTLSSTYHPDASTAVTSQPKRRILGLSRRLFTTVGIAAVVVVVGAIVGGVVGGVVRNRDGSTNSTPPSPTTSASTQILSDSKLAASNYTDANDIIHRSVFFQDTTKSLIGRFWDAQNQTWKTVNITQQLPGSNVLAGTPLASSSLDLSGQRIHVWCLLADQSIHGYYWDGQGGDPVQATWLEETSIGGARQFAMTGSSLASAWERPPAGSSSIGSWILAFQNTTGEIAVANYTGSETVAVKANSFASLSSLALVSELQGAVLSRLTLTYESNGNVLKSSYPGSGTAWHTGTGSGLPRILSYCVDFTLSPFTNQHITR